jgi:DNA polymerase-4
VFLPPDFEHYGARSREVMEVLRAQVERVEVVGLDEAYLDLTGLGRPKAAARRVKAAVQQATGLCCSIGIGPSKLVAKVASDADKPDGFVMLTQAEACERFAGESPALIPGIGPKSLERLRRAGIETLAQLAEAPGAPEGLRRMARFEDDRELELDRVRKSESRETTFDYDLRGVEALMPVLERLSEELCADLSRHERRGRTIGIKVRLDDFSTHTRARSVSAPVNDLETIRRVAGELLSELDPPRPVRLLGVRVAGLDESFQAGQLALSL